MNVFESDRGHRQKQSSALDHAGAPATSKVARVERLENYANNVSPGAFRRRRYERRGLLWRESGLERVRKCGRVPHGQTVGLRVGAGGAGFSGLTTCGSVWACPVCSAKIAARRADEIAAMVGAHEQVGGRLLMLTLTMRHTRGDRLADLWDALARAWRSVISGKAWMRERERYGLVGFTRVVEVTHGRNGWHVHVHALLYVDEAPSSDGQEAWFASIFGRWSRALTRRGLRAPLEAGQDMHLIEGPSADSLAEYVTKAGDRPGIAVELTHTAGKTARSALSTSTPWTFLDRIEAGDADALDLWRAWEQGSRGRRQIGHSVGLRDRLGLDEATATDEEIAAEEIGDEEETLFIELDGWRTLTRDPGTLAELLTIAEQGGINGAASWLTSRNIDHVRHKPPPRQT